MRIVVAPVPGQIRQVHVVPGAQVAAGQTLFEMDVMQMQQRINAPVAGKIRLLLVRTSDVVVQGALLVEIVEISE